MTSDGSDELRTADLTAMIVSAYVRKHKIAPQELSAIIGDVHAALARAAAQEAYPAEPQRTPAVSVKKSVTSDHIICLEDGKKFKALRRHLRTEHGLTPDEYRRKWYLPPDYPMVAPNYSAARAAFARKIGFGRRAKSDDRGFIGRMLRSK